MLDEIIVTKRREVDDAKHRLPIEDLKARIAHHIAERSLKDAIEKSEKIALIAELKRKSPSRGMLRERFDPVSLGQSLEAAGASALSVLTDEYYFEGNLEFMRDVKQFTEVPVIRKDFIIDPYQVYEAVFHGADAVLLIVRILPDENLINCLQVADDLGIDALVEVHSAHDMQSALSCGAKIIGINHRDLSTLEINTSLTEQLVPQIPSGKIIVAESGIRDAKDVARMKALGVHALLIGEALMTAPDPALKVKQLFSEVW